MNDQTDVIDELLGRDGARAVHDLRKQKPELAQQMQSYYESVFIPAPESAAALSTQERWLIAIRTAAHTRSSSAVTWYSDLAVKDAVARAAIDYATDVSAPWTGDARMSAIMRHVDLIVREPMSSSRDDISALSAAGLSPAAIVVLSQVVAYVSYQVRLVAALRAIGETA